MLSSTDEAFHVYRTNTCTLAILFYLFRKCKKISVAFSYILFYTDIHGFTNFLIL